MKIGVTGGTGFIGRYVVEAIRGRGDTPLVLDHHHPSWDTDAVDTFYGDVRDPVTVTEFAAHVDGIIHLAAVLGTQETIGNPRPAAETNVIGSLNVFEAATQYDLPVVYIAVGNWWMAGQGGGTYTITKTCAEHFARMFADYRGLRINRVRAMNAYGPRQSAAAPYGPGKVMKITPTFTCAALSGNPIRVYGDGTQVSDMVWVGDVARTLLAAFDAAADGNLVDPTIEAGPVVSHTVDYVARLIQAEAARLTGVEAPIVYETMRPGEVPGIVAADTTTLPLVGIDPGSFRSLQDGIRETVTWFHHHRGITWDPPKD